MTHGNFIVIRATDSDISPKPVTADDLTDTERTEPSDWCVTDPTCGAYARIFLYKTTFEEAHETAHLVNTLYDTLRSHTETVNVDDWEFSVILAEAYDDGIITTEAEARSVVALSEDGDDYHLSQEFDDDEVYTVETMHGALWMV